MNKLVFFVLLIFIIQGCGQKKSVETQFVVNLGALTGDALPQGGLIIYGQNSSGTQMFAQPISSSSYTIELENGDWSFYALSWTGPQIFDGELKCAQAISKLIGDPISVSLNLSGVACNSDKFSDEIFRQNGLIQPITILSCSDLSGLSSNSTCTSNPGLHQSIEIVLNSYMGFSPISKVEESRKLKSYCIPLTSSFAATNLRIPTGSSLWAINTEIHAYASSNCSGSLKNIFYFSRGLSQGSFSNVQIFDHSGNPDYVKIFLKSELNVPQPTISYGSSFIPANVGTFLYANPILSLNGFPITSCISTSLPPGLSIDSTSCVISGTPTAAFAQAPITVTVSTMAGLGTTVLNLNVVAVAPNLSYTGSLGTSGQLNSFMLVSPSTMFDGGAPISCVIDPATPLPSGLSVNPSNCDISGYPTVIPASNNFNVIVSNSVGSVSAPVTLSVTGTSVTIPTTPALSTPTSIINYSPATGVSNISQPSFNVSGQFNSGATVRIFSDSTCSQFLGSGSAVTFSSTLVNVLIVLPFDGSYTLYADQIDLNGNKSLCSPALGYYTLDRVPPLMPVVYGVEGPSTSSDSIPDHLLTSGHIAKVSWSQVSDASFYSLSITDFSNGSTICPAVTIFANQFQGDYSFENCGLNLGKTYAVQVKAFDDAGNFSTSTNHQFNLVSPPWFPLTQYGTAMKNHNAFWINGTGSGSGYSGMYVWGGENSTGPLPTSYGYDVSNDQWTPFYSGTLPSPRKDHTAIWIGGGILTWGGFNGTSTLADGYFWNVTTSQWSQIPSATTSRSGHAAFWQEISGSKRMVIFGGRGGSSTTPTYFNSLEVYDTNTNLWSTLSVQGSIPPAREKMAYAYFETEKKFFIWGGSNSGILSDGWILDFNFNPAKWININPINAPTNRTEMSYSSFNDGDPKFVIWGGRSTTNGSDLNTGYLYNLTTNSWTTMTISNAPLARSGAKMIWTGNEIMVWGGKIQGGATDTGAFYDVKSNTWLETSLQNTPEPRYGHSMILDPIAKEVYVYGGEDQNGTILSNLFKIKP